MSEFPATDHSGPGNLEPGGPEKAIVTGSALAHDSAIKHVTGQALYVDDIPEPRGMLYVATGYSSHAHARIKTLDLSAVRQALDVADVVTAADVPGRNDVSPVYDGDLLFAENEVNYVGQPLFAVAATSLAAAKRATLLAKVEYEPLDTILTPQAALEAGSFVLPTRVFRLGNLETGWAAALHQLSGEQYVRGQEHFYLEGQVSTATPNEDGGVHVQASSQHPTEVQKLVAKVLGLDNNQVHTEVRRMGGGFGGKESQAAPLACVAALIAIRTRRAVKYRMPRQDDMVQTGKRHDFWNRYQCGFDNEGVLTAVKMDLAALCGHSADLSEGIVDRAMFHAGNAYFLPNCEISGYRCRTHTVSNTAFRGFGGPKGMMLVESMMDDIARHLGEDPLDVRKRNLFRAGRDVTPYHQKIEAHVIGPLLEQLETSSDYRARRKAVSAYNEQDGQFRKGLALTPVMFGISFTTTHLNQGGALLHVYTDGSVHLSHGGTEMGQGLYTKVAQVVADVLGVDYATIQISATRTDKVPNTSPTAASTGTDINAMAALDAARQIKSRLVEFASEQYECDASDIRFEAGVVWLKDREISFVDLVKAAHFGRVHLSAAGFYRTPDIHFDKEQGRGHPFYYFACGAATAEVIVDTLTGEYRVSRIDVLHDVGNSINPAIDRGQIEGGFVQGMGWLTTEELLWDDTGRIIANSPANYKIPTAYDIPDEFNVELFTESNHVPTIFRSKAVGEPPLMLPISVWCALRDACASLAGYRYSPRLKAPATPEQVYWAICDAKAFQENSQQEKDT